MNLKYMNLKNIELKTIYDVFVDAFSDYQIKLDMSFEKFIDMMKRRSVDFTISTGVFDKKKLIGFVLNGKREINNKLIAYDSGTGLLQEYQGCKLSKTMLEENTEILKHNGIDKYILEVLTINKKALNLYKEYGFHITREFNCFKKNITEITNFDLSLDATIQKTNFIDINWDKVEKFCDFQVSWQNSFQSISNVNSNFAFINALIGKQIVGCGVTELKTGDIPLLAVDRRFRKSSIGSMILKCLMKATTASTLSALNIPINCTSSNIFLEKHKFNNFVKQYEMECNLK
jgi:ribosomal protein S18 acetylase RimI-like enzyme